MFAPPGAPQQLATSELPYYLQQPAVAPVAHYPYHQHAPAHHVLPGGWECAWDASQQRWYYFHRATNVTQWHPPPEVAAGAVAAPVAAAPAAMSTPATAPVQPEVAAASTAAAGAAAQPATGQAGAGMKRKAGGWYYLDPHGQIQGPFTVEQLKTWRGHLPMDLLVWYQGARASSPPSAAEPAAKEQQPAQEGSVDKQQQAGQQAAGAVAHVLPGAQTAAGSSGGDEVQGEGLRQDQAPESQAAAQAGIGAAQAAGSQEEEDGKEGPGSDAKAAGEPEAKPGGEGREETADLQQQQEGKAEGKEGAEAAGSKAEGKETHEELEEDEEDESPAVALADLLGDGVLLQDWRAQAGAQAYSESGAPVAPPAPFWERHLLYGPRPAAGSTANRSITAGGVSTGKGRAGAISTGGAGGGDGEEEGAAAGWVAGSSKEELAQAVLAGLPEDDEAVVIARLAAASGKSLQEVVDFNYMYSTSTNPNAALASHEAGGDAWAARAEYNPYTRRLQVAGADENAPGSLYKELSRWCNPQELEQSLQDAARRRNLPLPRSVWQELKERKLAAKKKARTAALLS